MHDLSFVIIESVAQLRAKSLPWDALWERSEVTIPTARAELLAQWVEQFAPKTKIRVIVVQQGEKWVAALPLMSTKVRRVLSAGALCGSTWAPGGALLVDPNIDNTKIMDLLIQAIQKLPWQLMWLQNIRLDLDCWRAFREAASRANMAHDVDVEYSLGLLDTKREWEAYKATWSKKHRNKMSNCERRLAKHGETRYVMRIPIGAEEVAAVMSQALKIEDRSWKGGAGSSVVKRGENAYLLRQAKQLAEWNQMEMHFLECNGIPVAFAYACYSKGVRHLCKIGYNPEYASISPGQLLFSRILEQAHRNPECQVVNFFGHLTHAISRWNPTSHSMGRIVLAPGRTLGRLALHFYLRTHRATLDNDKM
ncbi:MAG: GNAT family N-acetyltransferase [Pirellulales bacterium]|nr:GNAT family N-acetyltransferase [Pirellulales bacterium]